jgi:hypothetical protein
MSESKQRLPGFVGPAYESRVKRFDNQRLVNLYLEMDESGAGKGQEPAVMISTPGLKRLQVVGGGPIRATYTISNQQLAYVVSGNELYQVSGQLAQQINIPGNLLTSAGYVSIADNGYQAVIVDGQYGYTVDFNNPELVQITDPEFSPCTTVTYQDGYFIFSGVGTNEFFISNPTSSDEPLITFGDQNIAAKSGNSDVLIAAYSNNRQLYLFGASTMEIWFNAGAGVFPFARQDGRFSQVGCSSAASIARLGETLLWLGTNQQGGGVVYMLDNAMPSRVSNHAVEYAIQNYGNLAYATAYGYQQEGHYFYCLNIPNSNTTWVYDVMTKQWAERQSTENGVTDRHLGETHCIVGHNHIVGDYRNGNIYAYDLQTYTDNDNMVLRIRQTPHVSDTGNRVFYKLFEVDFQFGVGLNNDGTDPEAVDPRVTLEISNDGGQTFSNPIFASMGKIGVWNHRARWQRLGSSRDRVFKVTSAEPVKTQILAAWMDAESGYA